VQFSPNEKLPIASISKKPKRRMGVLKGKIKISKDFYEPLPKNILASFEGRINS
jgi:hypothetical protein